MTDIEWWKETLWESVKADGPQRRNPLQSSVSALNSLTLSGGRANPVHDSWMSSCCPSFFPCNLLAYDRNNIESIPPSELQLMISDQLVLDTLLMKIRARTIAYSSKRKKDLEGKEKERERSASLKSKKS